MVYAEENETLGTGTPLACTAFRVAEKKFQHLFKDATPSNPRSRRRAQALQQKKACAADLSDHGVLDVRAPSTVEAWLKRGTLQRHTLPCDPSLAGSLHTLSSCSTGHTSTCSGGLPHACADTCPPPPGCPTCPEVLAYTLPAHPGFVLLPALLPVAHQLQLMCDSLTRFPEPPATTNHNRQYGPITGTWVAAQRGLVLRLGRLPEPDAAGPADDSSRAPGPRGGHQVDRRQQLQPQVEEGCELEHVEEQQQLNFSQRSFWDCWQLPAQQQQQQQQHCTKGDLLPSDLQAPAPAPPTLSMSALAPTQPSAAPLPTSPLPVTAAAAQPAAAAAAAPAAPAVSATAVLRRMRWASLGPQFDWTRRLYDDSAQHRPLPPSLELLARQTVALVQQLTHLHSPGPLACGPKHADCACRAARAAPPCPGDPQGDDRAVADQHARPAQGARPEHSQGAGVGEELDRCARLDGGPEQRGQAKESLNGPMWGGHAAPPPLSPQQGPCAGSRHGRVACQQAGVPRASSCSWSSAATAAAPGAAGRVFEPDAALVNFYYEGDTLGGHCDDVEPDLAQPIVAASLGCDAVFLMGGPTRDYEPTPLLLRSGDVVVLGGLARNCFHGVPRVFTDRPLPLGPEVLDALPSGALAHMAASMASALDMAAPAPGLPGRPAAPGTSAAAPGAAAGPAPAGQCVPDRLAPGGCSVEGGGSCYAPLPGQPRPQQAGSIAVGGAQADAATGSCQQGKACWDPKEVLLPVLRHMQACRINISVRAVR